MPSPNKLHVLALLLTIASAGTATAQSSFPSSGAPPQQAQDDTVIPISPESEEFQKACEDFREHIKMLREIQIKFDTGTQLEEEKWRTQWNESYIQGNKLFTAMLLAGAKEFDSDPAGKANIARWLLKTVEKEVEGDRFEGLIPVLEILLKHAQGDVLADLHTQMGTAAHAMNDSDRALASLTYISQQPWATEAVKDGLARIEQAKQDWEDELRLREEDAQGEPLPVILIRTTKGDIEVELFENHAPETVANFIYLIEMGYYEDQPFSSGFQHLLIQGGGDDIVKPPYTIYGEQHKPGARKFFRGTMGLALNAGDPNSGHSQFFFALLPSTDLSESYTAFGRITKGMEVMANLTKIEPKQEKSKEEKEDGEGTKEPDEIITIEILSKRDHEYKPNKVQ